MDGDVIGAIIFLILMGLSVVARFMESRKEKRDKKWTMDDLPEETKRQIYGDKIPEHVRRGRGSRRPLPESRPPGVEMLEELFGGARHDEDDEPEWQPVHQPAQRRELPQQLQQGSVREPKTASAESPRPVPVPPPVAQRQREAPAQQQRRRTARPRVPRPPQPPQPPKPPQAPKAPAARPATRQAASISQSEGAIARDAERLRHIPTERSQRAARPTPAAMPGVMTSLDDVRQAIVFAEILGPPKGLQRGYGYYDYPPQD